MRLSLLFVIPACIGESDELNQHEPASPPIDIYYSDVATSSRILQYAGLAASRANQTPARP
jgi:hypothetical protein